MDSSGTLYELIEEANRRVTQESSCGTMTIEERKKAIDILLSHPGRPIRNRSIDSFRNTVKRRIWRVFHKS